MRSCNDACSVCRINVCSICRINACSICRIDTSSVGGVNLNYPVGDAPMGYGRWRFESGPAGLGHQFAMIDRLCVLKQYRLRGFAKACLEKIIADVSTQTAQVRLVSFDLINILWCSSYPPPTPFAKPVHLSVSSNASGLYADSVRRWATVTIAYAAGNYFTSLASSI